MNTLDLPDPIRLDDVCKPVIQWPVLSSEQLYGEALTSDSTLIHSWMTRFGLTASPGLFTEPRGFMTEWQFKEGIAKVWVESRGIPFFDALTQASTGLDPAWIHACLQAILPQVANGLELVGLRSIQEGRRAESLCCAWSVKALRFAIVHCDEPLFRRCSSSVGAPAGDLNVWVDSRLTTVHQLWTAPELKSMSVGDGVVIAHSSSQSVRAAWSLGQRTHSAPLMNWNWGANTMSWTGEHMEDGAMTVATGDDSDEGNGLDLNQVRIPVSFELASGSYSLSALQRIRPGEVITLDCQPLHCLVKMVSLGRTLASGQLVQIGDALALRVDRLHSSGEEAPHD